MRVPVLALFLLSVVGCAHARLDTPPLQLTIVVTGLREDERVLLKDQVCKLEGVKDCALVVDAPPPDSGKKKKRAAPPPSPEAKIALTYQGSLGELRHKIASLPHPGLEAQAASVTLGYRGFDNLAPTITVEGPKDGLVLADKMVAVSVVVPEPDIAEVEIAGNEALPQSGGRYSGDAELKDGDNAIVIKATDAAGNAREAVVHVFVDTVPPQLEVEVKILAYDKAVVSGKVKDAEKVLVDGKPIDIDMFGGFTREVRVDPDKSMLEIVATDQFGNTTKIRRSAKIASPMGSETK